MNDQDVKAAIINPYDEDALLAAGNIVYLKPDEDDENFWHSALLIEYGRRVYGDSSIFGVLSNGMYLDDVPVYFLVEEFGNVVFLDTSHKRYGKCGLLFLPSSLDFEQEEKLHDFLDGLRNYQITANYNMKLEDGIVWYDSDDTCSIIFDSDSRPKKRA